MAEVKNVHTVSDSDSEEDEDVNRPSREECQTRCEMFAEVTGTNSALAMFYLQDRQWDVERSISDYYADQDKDNPNTDRPAPGTNKRKMSTMTGRSTDSGTSATSLTLGPTVLQPDLEGVVRVLSWNIDGLDPDNLQSRTEGVCGIISREHPDVVFLQEVVHRSLKVIKDKLEVNYTVITGDLDPVNSPGAYFTAMLLKKTCVTPERARVLDFPGTLMSRDLLEVQCLVRGVPMNLLTSHLESTKDYSDERRHQLKTAFDQMLAAPPDRTVLFGGDLNLRDKEVAGPSAKPSNVQDLWEVTGKRSEAKFTWDLLHNDNKQLGTKFQPRCRFDRLYMRHSHSMAANINSDGGISTASSASNVKGTKNSGAISNFFASSGKHSTTTDSGKKSKAQRTDDVCHSKSTNPSQGDGTTSKEGRFSEGSPSGGKQDAKGSTTAGLKPVYFELVGIERLASCRRFPSDHWGILAHLEILKSLG